MSGELPGANPTMIRTWSCAQAKRETAGSASAPAAILKNARRGSVIESSQYRYQLSLRDAQGRLRTKQRFCGARRRHRLPPLCDDGVSARPVCRRLSKKYIVTFRDERVKKPLLQWPDRHLIKSPGAD